MITIYSSKEYYEPDLWILWAMEPYSHQSNTD